MDTPNFPQLEIWNLDYNLSEFKILENLAAIFQIPENRLPNGKFGAIFLKITNPKNWFKKRSLVVLKRI